MSSRSGLAVTCDVVVALAAVLMIGTAFLPWFHATLTSTGYTGWEPAPTGQASGVYAHPSLWAAVALSIAQVALLAARNYRRGRLRGSAGVVLLAVGSILVFLLVTADVLLMPTPWVSIMAPIGTPFPWEGKAVVLDGATLVMSWSYGATVAFAAATVSLAGAVVSLFLVPGPPEPDPAVPAVYA